MNLRIQKKINSNNLIYKQKTEGRSSKYFNVYQNPIDLFKKLRDGSISPKEVLKSQINFKSNLGKIKKGNGKSRSEDQISVIKMLKMFLIQEKKYSFFQRLFFFAI